MEREMIDFKIGCARFDAYPKADPIVLGENFDRAFTGMSLRDYFAAAALQATYINGFAIDRDKRAREAFAMADAMLKARGDDHE